MTVGAGLLLWKTGSTWAAALTFVTGGLLTLVLFLPRVYAPIDRALTRLEAGTLRGVTWVLLAALFILIFVPGRLLFRQSKRFPAFRSERPTTYWSDAKVGQQISFDRQY